MSALPENNYSKISTSFELDCIVGNSISNDQFEANHRQDSTPEVLAAAEKIAGSRAALQNLPEDRAASAPTTWRNTFGKERDKVKMK